MIPVEPDDGIKAVFANMRPSPGVADIWAFGRPDDARVTEAVALLAMVGQGSKPLFQSITVIHPPDNAEGGLSMAIDNALAETVARLSHIKTDIVRPWLEGRVRHVAAASFAMNDLLGTLPPGGVGAEAILILAGGRYRVQGLAVPPAVPLLPESVWTLHVAELGREVMAAIETDGRYVLIETGEEPPMEPDNRQRLLDIHDACGVQIGFHRRPEMQDAITEFNAWNAMAEQGRVGEALAALEKFDMPSSIKDRARIQLMSTGGLKAEVSKALRSRRAAGTVDPPEVLLLFAGLAQRAHDDEMATDLLGDALSGLQSLESLRGALQLACRLNDETLATQAADRVEALFEDRATTLEYRLLRLLADGDLLGAGTLLNAIDPTRAAEAATYHWLAAELAVADVDHFDVLARAHDLWPSLDPAVRKACTRHAQQAGDHVSALALIHDGLGVSVERSQVLELLYGTEQFLLHTVDGDLADSVGPLAETLGIAIRFMARHPTDAALRSRVSRLVTTKGSGQAGQIALAYLLTQAIGVTPNVVPEPPRARRATTGEVDSMMEAGLAWMGRQSNVPIGQGAFPASELPSGFHDGVAWAILSELESNASQLIAEGDETTARLLVALVAALAPHLGGNGSTIDIRAVKLLADRLAQANHKQKSRDVIETVVEIAARRPEAARPAWFAYGDVYRQTGDVREAMLSYLCGLSLETPLTATDAWYETLELFRLLRDQGDLASAEALVARAGVFLAQAGHLAEDGHRLETLRLQIALLRILTGPPPDAALLGALLEEVTANARQVFSKADEEGPIVSILVQSVRLGDAHGITVPVETRALADEALARQVGGVGSRLARYAKVTPTVEDLSHAATDLSGARYAADAARDATELSHLARRFLSGVTAATPPVDALFATELLTDHTATAHGVLDGDRPYSFATDPSATAAIAQAISMADVGVVLLGLDSGRRLVRTPVVDGQLQPSVTEPLDVFDVTKHRIWGRQENFPYEYGFLYDRRDRHDRVPNPFESQRRFAASLTGIGISALPPHRALIVPDVELANIPINLLGVGNTFAAEVCPVASAPSLIWLDQAAAKRGRAAGPASCWISTDGAADNTALRVMAERLQPTLADAGISLDTSATPPASLQTAELAIVGAHGGLRMEQGRFFRSVTDEDQLVLSGQALARALADSKVVILFVCSGGRLDLDPLDDTAVGLANLLLEQGCSAVLGSPWPMSSAIPVHWLPAFLDAWKRGVRLIDANAFANEAVARNLGDRPDYRFAMHLHGDPLVVRVP